MRSVGGRHPCVPRPPRSRIAACRPMPPVFRLVDLRKTIPFVGFGEVVIVFPGAGVADGVRVTQRKGLR